MKKIFTMLLMTTLMIAFVSCGASEKKAGVYTYAAKNLSVEMTVFAKDDEVTKIEQKSELDIKKYPKKKIVPIEASIKEMKKIYKSIDGAKYSVDQGKDMIAENIEIPVNDKTIDKIKKENLIPVSDPKAKTISLKKFTQSLEKSGWKKKK